MTVQAGSTINQEISSQVVIGTPFFVAPTGSVAANGAVTLGTALPTTYSGGVWLYFPAGAAFAGSVAGWYFTVMSSATVGQIYNVNYVSGQPVNPPAQNLLSNAIVAAGPGAYTGVVTAVTISIPLNPNVLGVNGFARFTEFFQTNNSAGLKSFSVAIGGVSLSTLTATTSTGTVAQSLLFSNGSQLVNVAPLATAPNPYAVAAPNQANINFGSYAGSVAPSLVVSLTIAVATDVVGISGLFGEFFYNS